MSETYTMTVSASKAEALKDREERTDWEQLGRMTGKEAEEAAASDPDAPPTDEDL